ncbi:MAG: hypothetical protein MRZ34_04035 [Bacillales bacterium]|nr:hypothetical protein [Bacillales bacterium]
MARVETDDIIEKVEVKEDDISLTDDDIKSAELLSLEKIEKDLVDNKSKNKKDTLFIILFFGIIILFIVLLPVLFK